MDGHILAFIELPPGFDIFVDKIKFQNFHVRIKCYMCQDNRQAAKGSVYLFALLAVDSSELRIHIHVVPLNSPKASFVEFSELCVFMCLIKWFD